MGFYIRFDYSAYSLNSTTIYIMHLLDESHGNDAAVIIWSLVDSTSLSMASFWSVLTKKEISSTSWN